MIILRHMDSLINYATQDKHTARVVNAMWGTFDEGALRAAKGKIKFTCAVDATASSPGARIHIE